MATVCRPYASKSAKSISWAVFASCCWKNVIRVYNTVFNQFQRAMYEKKFEFPYHPIATSSTAPTTFTCRRGTTNAQRLIILYTIKKTCIAEREVRGAAWRQLKNFSLPGRAFISGSAAEQIHFDRLVYAIRSYTHTRRCIFMFMIILYPTIGCGMVNITQ